MYVVTVALGTVGMVVLARVLWALGHGQKV